jgi:hypothetical protein
MIRVSRPEDSDDDAKRAESLRDTRIYVGMSVASFLEVFPKSGIPVDGDYQWHMTAPMHGLEDGKWSYTFKGGKLAWCLWNHYERTVDTEHFERSLAAVDAIIAEYSATYGQPTKHKTGNRQYVDPMVRRHLGYTVVKAIFETKTEKINVSFKFWGLRWEYFFLVAIEVQPPDYKYF